MTAPAESPGLSQTPSNSREKWIQVIFPLTAVLSAYYLILLSGHSIFGFRIRLRTLPFLFAAFLLFQYIVLRWLSRRNYLSVTALKAVSVSAISLIMSTFVADVGTSFYLTQTQPVELDLESIRTTDRQVWSGEFWPRYYYPTEQNFRLYKPGVRVSGNLYGGLYDSYPDLKRFPNIANSVLQIRSQVFEIDNNGFRNTTPVSNARIFTLGDSFTSGYGSTQEKIWPKVLEKKIGQPLYNLGTIGSPGEQMMLLKYLTEDKNLDIKLERLVWMVFEGNDLEDSYSTTNQYKESETRSSTSITTAFSSVARTIQEHSVVHRLLERNSSPQETEVSEVRHIDNVDIAAPVYHSSHFGYRLFYPSYIEVASKPMSYVLDHPNRPALDDAFNKVADLSRARGFTVTVVLAPSDARLYASYFDDFPKLSDEPYFLNYVEKLSKESGFQVINLYQLMKPLAQEELLYWRDDTHWNDRGNEVVAELIAKYLSVNQSPLTK